MPDDQSHDQPTGQQTGQPNEQHVPYSRFAAVNTKLQAALTELETLRVEAGQATTWKSELDRTAQQFQTYRTVMGAGVHDPDLIEEIGHAFGKLPEDQRAAGLEATVKTWVSDPSKAPKLLRPHLGAVQAAPPPVPPAAPGQQDAPARQAQRLPNESKGALPPPGPRQGEPSASDLMSMSQADYVQWSNSQRAARGLPPLPTK